MLLLTLKKLFYYLLRNDLSLLNDLVTNNTVYHMVI